MSDPPPLRPASTGLEALTLAVGEGSEYVVLVSADLAQEILVVDDASAPSGMYSVRYFNLTDESVSLFAWDTFDTELPPMFLDELEPLDDTERLLFDMVPAPSGGFLSSVIIHTNGDIHPVIDIPSDLPSPCSGSTSLETYFIGHSGGGVCY